MHHNFEAPTCLIFGPFDLIFTFISGPIFDPHCRPNYIGSNPSSGSLKLVQTSLAEYIIFLERIFQVTFQALKAVKQVSVRSLFCWGISVNYLGSTRSFLQTSLQTNFQLHLGSSRYFSFQSKHHPGQINHSGAIPKHTLLWGACSNTPFTFYKPKNPRFLCRSKTPLFLLRIIFGVKSSIKERHKWTSEVLEIKTSKIQTCLLFFSLLGILEGA